MTVDDDKRAMRAAMRRTRPAGDAAAVLARLAARVWPERVAGVWPLPCEIDLRPLLALLHARGHAVLLPQTTRPGEALVFRLWQPGGAMIEGRYGTRHPDGALMTPDALLVPLLAFDARCQRLGYGGGYYDRTLGSLPGRPTIGYGWASQQVEAVPVGPHDRALDAVVTEAGTIEAAVMVTGFVGDHA